MPQHSEAECQINQHREELEELEKTLLKEAASVSTWETVLSANGKKLSQLQASVDQVQGEQSRLEQELQYLNGQHDVLENSLSAIEERLRQLPDPAVDHDHEHTFQLADQLAKELKLVMNEVTGIVQDLNSGKSADVAVDKVTSILDAHLNSLQWVEGQSGLIDRRLAELQSATELHTHRR